MDGKGREGTYNFFLTTTGGQQGGQGIGHKGAAAPCHPAGAAHAFKERLLLKFMATLTTSLTVLGKV